jgi:hypothetical protein
VRGKACRPGHSLKNVSVKVGVTAVANPTSYGQHKLDAGVVALLYQIEVVRPVVIPSFRHLGDGHTTRAIGGERPQFESVFIEHGCGRSIHEQSS